MEITRLLLPCRVQDTGLFREIGPELKSFLLLYILILYFTIYFIYILYIKFYIQTIFKFENIM